MEQALTETFLKMDELLQTQKGREELKFLKNEEGAEEAYAESFAGCTANVALIYKNDLYVANAGDSRCVLCNDQNAVEMSIDHKPDNEPERERIVKAGGYVSEGRINGNLNLSRAIGDLEYKKNSSLKVDQQLIIAVPEVKKRALDAKDEFIIMGCDGIWETYSNQRMCDFVRERLNSKLDDKRVVEELLDANLAPDTASGMGCDNMTCILIVFNKNK